jgi:hypothetical protein
MKLYILEPSTRDAGPILVCDEDHNEVAEFFHNEHATVGQSYETALQLAERLVSCDHAQQTWVPIDSVPARSDAAMLLYFPAKVTGAYKQHTAPAMYRTGHPDDFPHRAPSHFMLLEVPADAALAVDPGEAKPSGEVLPLADHDQIGRNVLGLPWAIQSAVVTIAAHCTVIRDKQPTGDVADLAACISMDLLDLSVAVRALAVVPEQRGTTTDGGAKA